MKNLSKPPTTILGNRLLVRPLPQSIVSAVIAIPEAHKRMTRFHAEIVQRGTGKELPQELAVGTKILVNRIQGIPLDDSELKIIHMDAVLLYYSSDDTFPQCA